MNNQINFKALFSIVIIILFIFICGSLYMNTQARIPLNEEEAFLFKIVMIACAMGMIGGITLTINLIREGIFIPILFVAVLSTISISSYAQADNWHIHGISSSCSVLNPDTTKPDNIDYEKAYWKLKYQELEKRGGIKEAKSSAKDSDLTYEPRPIDFEFSLGVSHVFGPHFQTRDFRGDTRTKVTLDFYGMIPSVDFNIGMNIFKLKLRLGTGMQAGVEIGNLVHIYGMVGYSLPHKLPLVTAGFGSRIPMVKTHKSFLTIGLEYNHLIPDGKSTVVFDSSFGLRLGFMFNINRRGQTKPT